MVPNDCSYHSAIVITEYTVFSLHFASTSETALNVLITCKNNAPHPLLGWLFIHSLIDLLAGILLAKFYLAEVPQMT